MTLAPPSAATISRDHLGVPPLSVAATPLAGRLWSTTVAAAVRPVRVTRGRHDAHTVGHTVRTIAMSSPEPTSPELWLRSSGPVLLFDLHVSAATTLALWTARVDLGAALRQPDFTLNIHDELTGAVTVWQAQRSSLHWLRTVGRGRDHHKVAQVHVEVPVTACTTTPGQDGRAPDRGVVLAR